MLKESLIAFPGSNNFLKFYLFLFIFLLSRLLLVTIAINRKLKNKKSFPAISEITEQAKLIIIISLNHFCPAFSSSFVFSARYEPTGIPSSKIAIPMIIFVISCIFYLVINALNNLVNFIGVLNFWLAY